MEGRAVMTVNASRVKKRMVEGPRVRGARPSVLLAPSHRIEGCPLYLLLNIIYIVMRGVSSY